MAEHRPPRHVVPNPRAARTIGFFNVLFGASILFCSTMSLNSMLFTSLSRTPVEALEEAVEATAELDHAERLRKLNALEAEATFESVRERYRKEIDRLEEAGPSPSASSKLMMMGYQMPGMTAWAWVDGTTSIVLNLLLIASGAGLLQLSEWGRKLGLWVSGIKIVRLLILWTIWIVVVVPGMSRLMGETVGNSVGVQGGAPAPVNFTQLYAVIYSVFGVAMILFGAIYPAIALWVLSRPGVRAACRAHGSVPQ